MKVVIVKYNAGNVFSVQCALERIGVNALITDDPELITTADKVIFPGVGEASTAMEYLRDRNLDRVIKSLQMPVLGICIGMQLMCRSSEEGNAQCLGIFDVDVKRFDNSECKECKIPQMGWNTITRVGDDKIIDASCDGQYVYFVHSYYVPVCEHTTARCEYIHPFSAAIRRNNFYATQFHPEKSGDVGEKILKNFIEI